ncbi:MAG: CRISPR-associated endonuclease Cas1, partial [Verrucomicrobia bacterium]
MSSRETTAADLLPARILNEFVYCPRLFYYEHVEGLFLHNADTLRGADSHRRVDHGTGAMPAARKKQQVSASDARSASPAEETESETIHSRSVMLGSETLGVVAKLDLVEITLESPADADRAPVATEVRPVEYKSGAPRNTLDDGGPALWDTDRMQLGIQIMLLRENGYICNEGIVYYRATRQRVRYTLLQEDESWIRQTITAARTCAAGSIPEPLDHSPKCPRCSLVPICLPDETHFLRRSVDEEVTPQPQQLSIPGMLPEEPQPDKDESSDRFALDDPIWHTLGDLRPPRPAAPGESGIRRLITPDIDTKALYINTPGASLSRKGETLIVKEKGTTLAEIRIKDLHHLAIFGPASLSTALVQTLCERGVPISFFSMGGWYHGQARGHGLTNVFTRIEQFRHAADPEQALPLARLFVYGKIRNQRTLLMRNHIEPPPVTLRALKHAASAALAANSHATLLGIEGAAAAYYFRNFSGMLKGASDDDSLPMPDVSPEHDNRGIQGRFTFDFTRRNRRPPRDPVNALLSLAYSLLARDCTIAATAVGFDPYVGFFHQPRFGRPALALDIMEEFRPLIADSVVITTINNRMLTPDDFVRAGQAVNLSIPARKRFLQAYEKRMSDTITHPVFDYKVSYRRA